MHSFCAHIQSHVTRQPTAHCMCIKGAVADVGLRWRLTQLCESVVHDTSFIGVGLHQLLARISTHHVRVVSFPKINNWLVYKLTP